MTDLPATDWAETIPEGEAAELEALAEELIAVQRARAAKRGSISRALHAKGHGGARATFTVNADLPEHLRQGVFATPGHTYEALVRFSNGSGAHDKDATGDVRGIAIKLLAVEGDKIIPGLEKATTQDFLLIQGQTPPFGTAREFVALVVAASGSPLLLLPRFASRVGWGRAFGVVRALLASINAPFVTFAGKRLFSALPFAYGPYAVKAAILPAGEIDSAGRGRGPDQLADDLAARLADGPLEWDFAVQLFVDEAKTPIEDASHEWKESDAPFHRVARLTVPQQDVRSDEGRALTERIEEMSFDPWHALPAHRPLGNMMRARSAAYRLSTMERKASPEPGIG
ncbi:MAG: catalase [Sandaracinaceae bacterium]